ncbi:hypothetical protein [Phyllobacterium endophyticum]|jgi:hypothetical protein|uniref:Uncharacterized protein n=1 Tax=Phyllobacterium endophyticum TaxID=1149773 RepID=A0A2P7AN81_9HYPH|nr:hypothetical protein [Phyllobacterium endophyticum]MBB3234043.1 hypothetical protein [Phyllobacterium endophyticum]PSH55674.1 hypothetical protein CU100_18440 [Phyllobacterium endophyticum]TXR50968.1 hypothetical protein FVA77_00415 [Phyllobacterium endophyticum]TYR43813.1 hypothetical protein FY050_01115 [Phyllobacterium endophyticum]
MNKFAWAALLTIISAQPSFAASVKNDESSAQTIVVTEGSSKTELQVGPGETVEFCNGGCFVTFPNGDREALTGGETVEIKGGKVSIK